MFSFEDGLTTTYLTSDWNSSLLVREEVDRSAKIEKRVLIHCGLAVKDVYMYMLLHLNEEFDDDLLLDAMMLLE
jgi:hypothetical protein